jgi:hypothetical protein
MYQNLTKVFMLQFNIIQMPNNNIIISHFHIKINDIYLLCIFILCIILWFFNTTNLILIFCCKWFFVHKRYSINNYKFMLFKFL